MAKCKSKGLNDHEFRDKLLLNQWLIKLFGIYPWVDTGQPVLVFGFWDAEVTR